MILIALDETLDILDEMFLDDNVVDDVDLDLEEDEMIALDPGTVLEREYKGNKIKVKVMKSGNFSFNGKEYESRGDLMKAIGKGKTMQFTTFFGLNKNGEDDTETPKKRKKSADSDKSRDNDTDTPSIVLVDMDALNDYIDNRIRNFFSNK